MSYEAQEFSFEANSLILVEGENLDEGDSNGSGKSSLWDALSWALFGQTVRGLKGDEVVRRGSVEACFTGLLFEHAGKEYLVQRSRTDGAQRFSVIVDKKLVEKGTVALTQAWLLDELQIDFELFRCTVLFAQGETFNFVNSGNKAQKDILSKVMQVDFTASMNSVKEKVSEFQEKKEEIGADLLVLQSHVVEDPASMFAEEVEHWLRGKEERVEKAKRDCKACKHTVDELSAVPIALVDRGDEYEANKKLLDGMRKNLSAAEADQAMQFALADAIRKEMRGMEKYEATVLKDCPTCYQPMSVEVLTKAYNGLKEKFDEHTQRADAADAKAHDLLAKVMFTEKAQEILASSIRLIDENTRRLVDAKLALRAAMDRLKDVQAEENPFHDRIRAEVAKQEKIARKIQQLKTAKGDIEADLPYYLFWQNAFGNEGIKSFVFDLICSALTVKANKYLGILTNGFVTVSFDTQRKLKSGEIREKFDCTVSTGGASVPYATFSGGEKRRISLAVDMALSDLMTDFRGSGFSIVVLDEQDVHLDNSGRKAYMRLLKQLAKTRGVFVVAHDDEFKSYFDNVWKIRKQRGVSALV